MAKHGTRAQNTFTLYPGHGQPEPTHLVLWAWFDTAQLIHTAVYFVPCCVVLGLEGSVNVVYVRDNI